MTGQQTLEDVGVKRVRSEDEKHSGANQDDGQPESKKPHSAKSEQKPARPASSKENEGSNAKGAAKTSAKAKPEANGKNEDSTNGGAKAASENKGQDAKKEADPEQSAKADADPKAPVPASVPKPEGVAIQPLLLHETFAPSHQLLTFAAEGNCPQAMCLCRGYRGGKDLLPVQAKSQRRSSYKH